MAWRLKVRRQPHAGRAMLVFMALVLLFATTSTGFYALARLGPLVAILSGVGMVAADLAIWWLAMWLLPHKPARPQELLPGAGVLTAGIAILTLTTGLFMWRLEESSSMYGPLGLALVLLFWLYLIGHLFVGAAVLNAELWERAHTDPDERAAARKPRVDEESAMAEAFTEAAKDSGAADRRTRGLHRKEQR
jgi:uncharacterized BrkB/YihY/UPF0761 family membrane protein